MPYYSNVEIFRYFLAGSNDFTVADLFRAACWNTHARRDGFLDVHARTVRRWLCSEVPIPLAVVRALQYRAGDLSHIYGGQFLHWQIQTDTLYSPNGHAYTKRDIERIPAYIKKIMELTHECDNLRAELAALQLDETQRTNDAIEAADNVERLKFGTDTTHDEPA